jgi:hypothetical protein
MAKRFILMKKCLLILCISIAHNGFSQAQLKYVVNKYFRTHPLEMKFSSFIMSLHKDPWLTIDTENRRTDSAFYYLSGTYKNYNPFQYIPKELRLILAEMEIIHEDSLKTPDTIMNLQLLGINDSGAMSKKMVQREFKRFHNNNESRFSSNTYRSFKAKDESIIAEIYNYFVFPYSIAPITVAWGILPETNQYSFTITLRFKVKENIAVFIVNPDQL